METDIAFPERAVVAFPTLESARFTDLGPASGGFYQQGSGPNITGNFQASAVNTGVMAVAEANYGRMDLSLRYATFIAKELDLEQPDFPRSAQRFNGRMALSRKNRGRISKLYDQYSNTPILQYSNTPVLQFSSSPALTTPPSILQLLQLLQLLTPVFCILYSASSPLHLSPAILFA